MELLGLFMIVTRVEVSSYLTGILVQLLGWGAVVCILLSIVLARNEDVTIISGTFLNSLECYLLW